MVETECVTYITVVLWTQGSFSFWTCTSLVRKFREWLLSDGGFANTASYIVIWLLEDISMHVHVNKDEVVRGYMPLFVVVQALSRGTHATSNLKPEIQVIPVPSVAHRCLFAFTQQYLQMSSLISTFFILSCLSFDIIRLREHWWRQQ